MTEAYKNQKDSLDAAYCMEQLKTLPAFCRDYYTGRLNRLSAHTQRVYMDRMRIFLTYLHENSGNPVFTNRSIAEYTYDDIILLTKSDATEFVVYLRSLPAVASYKPKYKDRKNTVDTADQYISALSSYWTFFCNNIDGFVKNPWRAQERHVKDMKRIIHIADGKESEKFLDAVYTGNGMTKRQKQFHNKNELRQTCIIQLLLDTGIRVSELVGLDIADVNIENCTLDIVRKGHDADTVYFSDQTADLLVEYLERRKVDTTAKCDALFTVTQGKKDDLGNRVSVRSIERLVKRYAEAAGLRDASKLSPHKLRSTYAQNMLRSTGNIELVRMQLGQKSLAATQKYARASKAEQEVVRNNIFS